MTPQEERSAAAPAAEREHGGGESAASDADDMFGPPRAAPAPAPRPRISMISARLRANEERKRVIEICSQKLESIEDPARDLRRSVCINNAYCRLSEEARREKEARRGERCGERCGERRAREPAACDDRDGWAGKRARRAAEDECLALLDAIPELGDCARLARLPALPALPALPPLTHPHLPRADLPLLLPGMLAVLDS